jgi:Xaa-Pro aminopeptidase
LRWLRESDRGQRNEDSSRTRDDTSAGHRTRIAGDPRRHSGKLSLAAVQATVRGRLVRCRHQEDSMLGKRIPAIQSALAAANLDGWLFMVFQDNDPVSRSFLGLPGLVSRRCYYLVPRTGEPIKLCHGIEPAMLDRLPGRKTLYTRWSEHATGLKALVAGCKRLAAQYSPNNELPGVSRLDAGTAEFLRAAGCELVSSADLVQQFAAVMSPEQLAGHQRANVHLHRIVKEAFAFTSDALRSGRAIHEFEVQQFITAAFRKEGLVWADEPIVGVNGNAADPHYMPTAEKTQPIKPGDFLLIDLWAKEGEVASVYADITWCGVCAQAPTERQAHVWRTATGGRDAGWELIRSHYPHAPVRGFEVDDATRAVIDAAGFGAHFIHRTGHSIFTTDHGPGANMDNLETHDTRPLIAGTCFSIEPGIYFAGDFGVRTEINVVLHADRAEITGAAPQGPLLTLL